MTKHPIELARRFVWFKPPEETLAWPALLAAHFYEYGTWDDWGLLRRHWGDGRNFVRGMKRFEVSNHLGNVLAVVSDRCLVVTDGVSELEWDHYRADTYALHDYDPFGMLQAWQSWEDGPVRHGFNGKERDDEWHGAGDSYDFGARMLDPRGCRWLSTDPLAGKYPSFSPYIFGFNNPIYFLDSDGREGVPYDFFSLML